MACFFFFYKFIISFDSGQKNSFDYQESLIFNKSSKIHQKEEPLSGSCGVSLTYALNNNTLNIYGHGDMTNYSSSSPPPWTDYRNSIEIIIISQDVISIGTYSFEYFSNLRSVTEQCHFYL